MQASTPEEALPEARDIAFMLARFACNNHTITDEAGDPIGIGLYPLGALFNHSDAPNAVPIFQGRTITFRAIDSIPAGQEMTVSYVELAAPRHERQHALQYNYFFNIDASEDAGACQASASLLEMQHYTALQDKRVLLRTSSCCPFFQDGIDRIHFHSVSDVGQPQDSVVAGCGAAARVVLKETSDASTDDYDESSETTASRLLTDPYENGGESEPSEHERIYVDCWGIPAGPEQETRSRELAIRLAALVRLVRTAAFLRDLGRHKAVLESAAMAAGVGCQIGHGNVALSVPARSGNLVPGPGHIWHVRRHELTISSAVARSKYALAHSAAQALTPIYSMAYPQVYPNLGLHYALTAKLGAWLGQVSDKAIIESAQKAANILQHTHKETRTLRDIMMLIYDMQRQLTKE